MTERILDLIVDESKWLPVAMVTALVAVLALARELRARGIAPDLATARAMNLFYGWTIGVMAAGHLLAITVKAARGSLEGSPWFLYPVGVALGVPAWWLALRAGRWLTEGGRRSRQVLALNAWLGVCLVALGLHNWPLAAPAALNLAYQAHSRRAVGWTIAAVTVLGYVVLLVGSLVFMASGQSFEQFTGRE